MKYNEQYFLIILLNADKNKDNIINKKQNVGLHDEHYCNFNIYNNI